jgi:hypothetical protein
MHVGAEQLEIASQIDAKVQRLAAEGHDDVAIFVELVDDMPAFRRLLDAGPHARINCACGLAGSTSTQRSSKPSRPVLPLAKSGCLSNP